jgi:diguanylate cyclase (GGDEF)-like protein/PAS domain S-box-containing protein
MIEQTQRRGDGAGPGAARAAPAATPAIGVDFRDVVEALPVVVLVITADPADPRIVYANAGLAGATGYRPEELVGHSPCRLAGPGSDHRALAALHAAACAGQPGRLHALLYARSSAPFWADLRMVPCRDAAGAVTRVIMQARDVTQEKRRLDEVEALADRDTVTGLPTGRAVLGFLARELAQGGELCLMHLDIDLAASQSGAWPADEDLLMGVGDVLADNVRRADLVGRIGPRRFAIGMPRLPGRFAFMLAERLRDTLENTPIPTAAGPVHIAVRVGVATAARGETDGTDITARAGAALDSAGLRGSRRVQIAQVGTPTTPLERTEMTRGIRWNRAAGLVLALSVALWTAIIGAAVHVLG